MKLRLSHKFLLLELGAGLTLLALAAPWVPSPHSMAQQDNRQLKREQTQTNGAQQRRIALVIGNGAYQNVKALKNPPNDATLLAATLRKLGFEVTVGTDKSQREMKQLIREFGQRLRGGGGVGLFYFAGHGVQARGHNYLIPVDAEIQTEADLEDVAVDVNYVLNMMDDAQNALNIAILDACRNNPFARSFRSAQEGLAQVKAPTGTLIAYATSPDSVAADGGGANSPYAEELAKQIQASGVLLETMFRRVAEQVSSRSGGRQEPWYSANVKGDFFFSASPSPSLSNSGDITQSAKVDAVAVEREYWEAIRTSNDPQDYKDYLQTYPSGTYAGVARAKIRQIETAPCTEANKAVWYKTFNQNRTTKAEVAYEAGKKYLSACPNELSDIAEYLKKWVGAFETNSGSNKTNEPASAAKTNAWPPRSVRTQEGIEMVYIPPGRFMMGSNNGEIYEKPVHEVTISQPFYIGKYEVTQGQWQTVMGNNPSQFKDCGSNCPVEQVTWDDAQAFINKLNETNDIFKYRLPSEAEWEYACRAGMTGEYYVNDVNDVNEIGWFKRFSTNKTHSVGGLQANAFGLYDMSGNVWEWCRDWFHPNYEGAPGDGSAWLSGGEKKYRVLRGGSWIDYPNRLRSAFRYGVGQLSSGGFIGLRVVAERPQ